jgi:hypothetical protein
MHPHVPSLTPQALGVQVRLIFGNVTADDVLIQAELDALIAEHPGRFRVRPAPAAPGPSTSLRLVPPADAAPTVELCVCADSFRASQCPRAPSLQQ